MNQEDEKLSRLLEGIHSLEIEVAKVIQKVDFMLAEAVKDRAFHDSHETRLTKVEGTIGILKWLSAIVGTVTAGLLVFFISSAIQGLGVGG